MQILKIVIIILCSWQLSWAAPIIKRPVNELLEQAKSWESLDRIDLARVSLEKLLLISHENPDALAYLVRLDLRENKNVDALQHFTRLQKAAPLHRSIPDLKILLSMNKKNSALLQQARLLAKSGNYLAAIKIYDTLFPQHKPSPQLQFEYSLLLARTPTGWSKANKGFTLLSKQYPKNKQYRLALIEHRLSKYPQNQRLVKRLKPFLKDPRFQRQAAAAWRRAVYRLSEDGKNIPYFTAYLAYDPKDEAIQKQLKNAKSQQRKQKKLVDNPAYKAKLRGLAALKKQQYGIAKKEFTYTLKHRQNDIDAIEGIGMLLLRQSQYSQARKYFKRALHLQPKQRSKWNALIETCDVWGGIKRAKQFIKENQVKKAEAALNKVISIKKEAYAMTLLAELKLQQGDASAATVLYQQALAVDPGNANALTGLVELHLANNDIAAAHMLLKRLSLKQKQKLGSDYQQLRVKVLRAKAEQLSKQNRLVAATQALEQAKKLQPNNAWLLYDLAKLYRQQGQAEKAERIFQQALKQKPHDQQLLYAYSLLLASLDKNQLALDTIASVQAPLSESMLATKQRLTMTVGSQQVQQLETNGQHILAIQRIKTIEQQLSQAPEYREPIAQLWSDIKEPGQAIAYLDQFNDVQSKQLKKQLNFQRQLLKAEQLEQQKKYSLALDTLNHIDAPFNQQPEVIQLKASVYRSLKQPKKAIDYYQALQRKKPQETWIKPILLSLYIETNQSKQADALIKQQRLSTQQSLAARLRVYDALKTHSTKQHAEQYFKQLQHDYPNEAQVIQLRIAHIKQNPDPQQVIKQLEQLQSKHQLDLQSQQQLAQLKTTYSQRLSVDFLSHMRSSSGAKSTLSEISIPIEWRIPRPNNDVLFFRFDYVSLDAGSLDLSSKTAIDEFGQGVFCAPSCPGKAQHESVSGNFIAVGYEHNKVRYDLGLMPQNFLVNDWVGGIKWGGDWRIYYWGVDVSRRPVTSTKLSYAGSQDIRSQKNWGGVKKTGVSFSFGFDDGGKIGYWSNLDLHVLTGKNVADNPRQRLLGGVYWRLLETEKLNLTLGFNAQFWRHAKSLDEFTFGHGGYYSPNRYSSIAVPIELFGRLNTHLSYKLKASISSSTSDDDTIGFFPNDNNLQNAAIAAQATTNVNPFFAGGSGGGVGYSFLAGIEYKVNHELNIGFEFSTEQSADYHPVNLLAYLRYYFDGDANPVWSPPKPLGAYAEF